MKIFKNIFKITAIRIALVQYFFVFCSIFFIFKFGIDFISLLLILLGYFLYGGIGFSMMLHRYFTHRSFEFRSKIIYYIFEFISIISLRGSIIGWVYVHRQHHKNADTENDPHSPLFNKWRVFFPSYMKYDSNFNKFLIKDLLNSRQIFINDFYFLIILVWSIILFLIDINLFLYFYLVPISLLHIMLMLFIYFGHADEPNDTMINDNLFFGIFLFGEGWHINHHKNPCNHKFSSRKFNLDPIDEIIKIIKK